MLPLTATLHPPPATLPRCSKLRTATCEDDDLGYDGPLRQTDGGQPLAWLGNATGFPGSFVCNGWNYRIVVVNCDALIDTFNDYVATAESDKAAEDQTDFLAVAIPVGVAVVLAIVACCCCCCCGTKQAAASARRAENAQPVQLVLMQQPTPSARPAPTALPPVARPVLNLTPARTWTPPKPAAPTAMSSDAPPAYAAYMGATATGADDMFNTDGTFK